MFDISMNKLSTFNISVVDRAIINIGMELVIVLSFCSLLFSNVYGIRVSQKKCDEYRKMHPRTSEKFDENDVEAAPKEFPFMARIQNETHHCSGILISEKFILSAASCDNPGKVQAFLGDLDEGSNDDQKQLQLYSVIKEFVHPRFNRDDWNYNIKLIQLNESVKFNEYIRPACLPESTNSQKFVEVGWGATNVRTSSRLHKLKLNVVPNKSCKEEYDANGLTKYIREIDNGTIFCARPKKGVRELCTGNSGAALLSSNPDAFDEIIGIGSSSFGCDNSFPDVFVRASTYLDWIESVVWSNSNSGVNSFQLKNSEMFFTAIAVSVFFRYYSFRG